MSLLKYKITKFDTQLKMIDVSFDDGTWAQLRLSNPLPKNQQDLENLIRDYAAPIEAIQAQQNPDADLSYIENLVDKEFETTRKSLSAPKAVMNIDEEALAESEMWEELQFKKQVGKVLVEFGLLSSNPADIPVTTL